MKHLTTIFCLTLTLLLGGCAASIPFHKTPVGSYEKGRAAHESGDYATTLRVWEPLAKQGHYPYITFFVGSMYERGQGVPEDAKTAVKWYALATKQGNINAMWELGQMYRTGRGVPQDYKTAVKWYTLLASKQQGKPYELKEQHPYHELRASALNYVKILQKEMANTNNAPTVTAKKSSPPSQSAAESKIEKLRKMIARLEKEKNQKPKPKQVAKKTPEPTPETKPSTSGSGFFISKLGHVITNQHVVDDCKSVKVGDNAKKQVIADILETDRRNDLALLKISSLKMASVETKSLIQKLGIKIVPLASDGLLRFEDVDLGEKVLVAGYPYGEMFSNSIKVTGGMVSANRGLGDDTGQFQMDAAVQPGNSGGPIYDENGNIVGVVVAQLNKMKFAKQSGSMPENVNFGIKASTVRQFLSSSGLPTKWSERTKVMSTKDLAKIAEKQTVMVMCHQ